MSTFWSLPVLCVLAQGLHASDHAPAYLAGGLVSLHRATSDLTTDRPWHAAIGWSEPNVSNLIGQPSLDIDWTHAIGQGNQLDVVSVCYCERMPLTDSLYLGFGVGSFYDRWKTHDSFGATTVSQHWQPGGRAMVGLDLGGSIFTELSYFYSGTIDGVNTNALALCVGFWF